METMIENIEFNQSQLSNWFKEIDSADAIIITYIERHGSYFNTVHHPEDEAFIWLHLPSLIQELPILNLSYDGVRERIRKLVEIGILQSRLEDHTLGGQQMMYVKLCITNIIDQEGSDL